MGDHKIHEQHSHQHGAGCGHTAIQHEGHTGYLHDGHLHCAHEGHVDEHVVAESGPNKAACTPGHSCGEHDAKHSHGKGCGHEAIPHGSHTDYVVKGHLHHPHDGHCDDHGAVPPA
ncbi:MAG: hypothetical protein ACREP6_09965 [Candidatus Binataceae bacterium]